MGLASSEQRAVGPVRGFLLCIAASGYILQNQEERRRHRLSVWPTDMSLCSTFSGTDEMNKQSFLQRRDGCLPLLQ